MVDCDCCGTNGRRTVTCGRINLPHPCLRRATYTTITEKFDAICDLDNEVCDSTRRIFEQEIRDYIRDQEGVSVPTATSTPPVQAFTKDQIIDVITKGLSEL